MYLNINILRRGKFNNSIICRSLLKIIIQKNLSIIKELLKKNKIPNIKLLRIKISSKSNIKLKLISTKCKIYTQNSQRNIKQTIVWSRYNNRISDKRINSICRRKTRFLRISNIQIKSHKHRRINISLRIHIMIKQRKILSRIRSLQIIKYNRSILLWKIRENLWKIL